MVHRLPYDKVIKYVTQGFERYIRDDGLTVSQATSRLIVEFEIQTDEFEDVEWTLYLLLAKLGFEKGELRNDVRNRAMEIINSNELVDFWKVEGVNRKELEERERFIKQIKNVLTEV